MGYNLLSSNFEKFIHKDGGMRLYTVAACCGYDDVERLATLSGGRIAAPTSHVGGDEFMAIFDVFI